MDTMTVGEFKAKFSEVVKALNLGHEVAITYGKKRKKIAVVSAYSKIEKKKQRKLGILKGKATIKIMPDFKMTDEEFLAS